MQKDQLEKKSVVVTPSKGNSSNDKTQTTNKNNAVKTGDNTQLAALSVAATVAAVAGATIASRKKKNLIKKSLFEKTGSFRKGDSMLKKLSKCDLLLIIITCIFTLGVYFFQSHVYSPVAISNASSLYYSKSTCHTCDR